MCYACYTLRITCHNVGKKKRKWSLIAHTHIFIEPNCVVVAIDKSTTKSLSLSPHTCYVCGLCFSNCYRWMWSTWLKVAFWNSLRRKKVIWHSRVVVDLNHTQSTIKKKEAKNLSYLPWIEMFIFFVFMVDMLSSFSLMAICVNTKMEIKKKITKMVAVTKMRKNKIQWEISWGNYLNANIT